VGRAENTFGKQDTHCTPPEVYEPILEALRIDRFGLDPFGNPHSTVPAREMILLPEHELLPGTVSFDTPNKCDIIHKPTGALVLTGSAYDFDWSGRGAVFCNGPTSDCKPWAEQAYGDKGGDENVSLWPVRTGAHWWQDFVAPSDAITFYRGRITFKGSPHQAPWHNALSYIGPRGDLFVEGMKKYGWTVRNRRDW
jgi:hypothetical protein